ncbi:MAG: hypothetical protein JST30_09900 [Armatimonadetes bacterium]|nr:hypothetical protein [Armatimonadota bacterium]
MTLTVLALASAMALQEKYDVDFAFDPGRAAKSVAVAGSFNDWNKDATLLKRDGSVWTVRLQLPPGKYWYKFVVDGDTWTVDPKASKNEDDGNGNTNSVLYIWPPDYLVPASPGDGRIAASGVRHAQGPPSLNWDRGRLSLTVTARPDDVRGVSVWYQTGSGRPRQAAMAPQGGDEFTTRYSVKVPWDRKSPFRYSFSLDDGGRGPATFDRTGLWYARGVGPQGSDSRFVLEPKSFRPLTPPKWVETSVVYQIFPDRFANGDPSNDPADVMPWNGEPTYGNWFGGDAAGVRAHLGHLKRLGVGCVYFNPVFEGPSNHRYEATDYKKIDHRFGTNQEFAALTRDMHRQGIKTVLDGVFNHTAVDFFAFSDVLKNQQGSKFLDWYSVKSFPVTVSDPPPYEAWFGFKSMPKLMTTNPATSDYLMSVPDFWDKTAKIDGWRLDVANEVSMDTWRRFRKRVKAHGEDKWIVGEIWGDGSPWLKGDQFDSVMNYRFRDAVLAFAGRGKTTPRQYWNALMKVYDDYGPQVSRNMMNLLGSHDTPRLLDECGGDPQRARFAAMLQFTWTGAPCVYYGDELGMAGGRDPANRRGMRWDLAHVDNGFLRTYTLLSALRASSPALQSGDPTLVACDDDKGLLVFRRQVGDEWAVVAVNDGSEPQKVRLPWTSGSLDVESFRNDPVSTGSYRRKAAPENGAVTLTVSPLSVTVASPARSPRPRSRTSLSTR